jgi:hypothetical protein
MCIGAGKAAFNADVTPMLDAASTMAGEAKVAVTVVALVGTEPCVIADSPSETGVAGKERVGNRGREVQVVVIGYRRLSASRLSDCAQSWRTSPCVRSWLRAES